MRSIFSLGLCTILVLSSCSTLNNINLAPSNLEALNALKSVLNSSTYRALDGLSNASNNGIEAILPDELKPVLATLKTLGLGDELNNLNKSISKVSGAAVNESEGIMKDAISELKISDAASVILGGEDAASIVLKNAMYGAVTKRYASKLDQELAKVPEVKYWDTAVTAYNLFSKNKINDNLSDFLAKRAVDAMFIAIGKEEAVIRKNPNSLNDPLVTRVFDYYKNNK